MGTIDIRRSTLVSPDAARLITALNAELSATFPEPGATHFSLRPEQVADEGGAFLIAYINDAAVGCGAIRRLNDTTTEVRRMYVDPSVRGQGIGHALVEALEGKARRLGAARVVLETGTRLAPAIRLYEGMAISRSRSSAVPLVAKDEPLLRQDAGDDKRTSIRAPGRDKRRPSARGLSDAVS